MTHTPESCLVDDTGDHSSDAGPCDGRQRFCRQLLEPDYDRLVDLQVATVGAQPGPSTSAGYGDDEWQCWCWPCMSTVRLEIS